VYSIWDVQHILHPIPLENWNWSFKSFINSNSSKMNSVINSPWCEFSDSPSSYRRDAFPFLMTYPSQTDKRGSQDLFSQYKSFLCSGFSGSISSKISPLIRYTHWESTFLQKIQVTRFIYSFKKWGISCKNGIWALSLWRGWIENWSWRKAWTSINIWQQCVIFLSQIPK